MNASKKLTALGMPSDEVATRCYDAALHLLFLIVLFLILERLLGNLVSTGRSCYQGRRDWAC